MVYDIHIFSCTNERVDKSIPSCGEAHGNDLVAEFKKQLANLNSSLKIRAQKSGCLGICKYGPTIAVYPEGVFYVNVKKEDISEIINSHFLNKKPVERLLLKK